ncbi:hypothetical protein TorRG33x02_206600 [Trema orientale]|uniref:Uncharacterized protein n=1 Tax=Trema orientale TaxID=63057 RepID=A0A2P5EDA1_TREOI|nr:hypothetical protein TorRG33x02_206600 [Trema orientale]
MAREASSRTLRHSREEKLRAKREKDWWTTEQNEREMHAEEREEIEMGGSELGRREKEREMSESEFGVKRKREMVKYDFGRNGTF